MKKIFTLLCICGFLVQTAFIDGQPRSSNNPSPGLNRAQGFMNDAMSEMDRAFAEAESEPTHEDKYFLGRAVAASILSSYKPYIGNPALTRYLNLICQAIVIHSPEIELFNGCFVDILDTNELNAFASPGGHIYITRGLVESTKSEDMLAAIIAHELAHIKLKHGINIINDLRIINEANLLADRAAELAGRDNPAVRRLMLFRGSVAAIIDTLMVNGYSQSQELEADREAMALLAASGYDPRALPEVLRVLLDSRNSINMKLNTTHPSPEERILNVNMWLRSYQVEDTRSYRESRFRNK
ncbi:MAG: M48 family metalloprotease [Treponema sp.]|jgi:predicted Zn-dependent protease|nr:M48 family metalloprotease [Treponema sp.]